MDRASTCSLPARPGFCVIRVSDIGGDPGNISRRGLGFFLGVEGEVANGGADEEATDEHAGGAKRKVAPLVKNTPRVMARWPF